MVERMLCMYEAQVQYPASPTSPAVVTDLCATGVQMLEEFGPQRRAGFTLAVRSVVARFQGPPSVFSLFDYFPPECNKK